MDTNFDMFLDVAVEAVTLVDKRVDMARAMLKREPGLAVATIYAAAATGSVAALRGLLKKEPGLANMPGGPRGWVPLLYVCYSLLLRTARTKRQRAPFAQCARLLLKVGADVNASFLNPEYNAKESALYGASGRANDVGLTRVLVAAGADVNDGETLYHTAEHKDHACLKLILQRKPENVSYCMCHKMDYEDPSGVALFLKHGADPNVLFETGAAKGMRPLHWAILRDRSEKTLDVLLQHGADPTLATADGTSPYAFAMLRGNVRLAKYLARHGAPTTLTVRQQFFAACAIGNGRVARKLLAQEPGLMTPLSPHAATLLPTAAARGNRKAVMLMLALGFPLEAPGEWNGTALHQAVWHGHVGLVRFLLEHGASLETKNLWGGDVLATARHAVEHGPHKRGAGILRMLERTKAVK